MNSKNVMAFISLFLIISLSTLDALAARSLVRRIADGALGGEKILIKARGRIDSVEIVDTQTAERFAVEQTRANRSGRRAEFQLPFSRRDTNRIDITVSRRGEQTTISRAFALVNNNDILPAEVINETATAAFGDETFNNIPVIPSIEVAVIAEDDDDNGGRSTGGGGGRGQQGEQGPQGEPGDSFFNFDAIEEVVSNVEGDTFVFKDPEVADRKFAYYSDKNALIAVRNSDGSDPGADIVGNDSMAIGLDASARGNESTAIGRLATANGLASSAFGLATFAEATGSTVLGFGSLARGSNSTVIGFQGITNADARSSIAISTDDQVVNARGAIGMGNNSQIDGINSIAIGGPRANTTANAHQGIAIGSLVTSDARNAIAIGRGIGFDEAERLTNSVENSFAVGINSTVPTLHVGPGDGSAGSIGDVGIGTQAPAQRLHVAGIDAALRLEPQDNAPANAALGDIYVDSSEAVCVFVNGAFTRIAGTGNCI